MRMCQTLGILLLLYPMIGSNYNIMKKRIMLLGCIVGIITLLSGCSSHRNLSMLQLNIWQEGTMIPGGFDPSLMK